MAEPTAPARDWIYLRVYVTDLPAVRALLAEAVRPTLAGFRTEVPDLDWFFLQYADQTGLQLRVRVRGPRDRLARWEAALRSALRNHPGAEQVTARLYEPELDKYRGPAGLRLAEKLFVLGSDVALRLAAPGDEQVRLARGAAHTWLVTSRLPDPTAFLHQYAWYWSGRGSRALPWQQAIGDLRPDTDLARTRARGLRALIDHDRKKVKMEKEKEGFPLTSIRENKNSYGL